MGIDILSILSPHRPFAFDSNVPIDVIYVGKVSVGTATAPAKIKTAGTPPK